MDPIKEAFAKAKQDVTDLRSEISSLRAELLEIRTILSKNPTHSQEQQTDKQDTPTIQQSNTNLNELPNTAQYSSISPNTPISTGNRGVPTNKQTNQQTDNPTQNPQEVQFSKEKDLSSLLSSFDSIKEQLKIKFKSLTKQEMSVFVAIYMLEEQKKIVDYPSLAAHLSLTETSIRDYVLKMTKKGIPIIKTKQNNKKILLSVDQSLRKIAPLSSIFLLREPTKDYLNRYTEQI